MFSSPTIEDTIMSVRIGLLSIAGLLGLLASAEAASPFDGTYQLYSSTKITESFVSRGGNVGFCPDRKPGALTVVDGRARYISESGANLDAPVQSNGQFETGFVGADGSGFGSAPHYRRDRRQRHGTCAPDRQFLQL
jgi:hypothetical protein